MKRGSRMILMLVALGLVSLSAPDARGQGYPTRPIRMVVGFAAGGPTDVIARIVAQDMTTSLGQPVVVENRPGANSLIATEAVARATPDGYTILMATLSLNVNPIMIGQARYETLRDFAPIGLAAMLPLIAVTGAGAPFDSLQFLLEAGRAAPGRITYGSAGNGSSGHLAGALLAHLSGVEMAHVPFRGNAPALTDVMAGRVSYMFYAMVGISEHIAQNRLRPLAVSTAERHPDFPGVPTMAELGFQGFADYTQGIGLLAPARTPAAVVERLNAAIRESLAKPETIERLGSLGAVVRSSSPAEYAAFLREDAERWARVIRAAGITGQPD
jgi:tripartite-type tricarboxylate transporter receptor subunit TctC